MHKSSNRNPLRQIISKHNRPIKVPIKRPAPTVTPRMTCVKPIIAPKQIVEPGLTVQVPQGLGDIFWVYQKLAPYFEQLNFRITLTEDNDISRRSENWLSLLPKTGSVKGIICPSEEYQNLIESKISVRDILLKWENGERFVQYSCNKYLEEGIRIDEIDDYLIDTNVPILSKPFELPFDKYTTFYVSGSTKPNVMRSHGVWDVEKWIEFLKLVYAKMNINYPVIVIGANFDEDVVLDVKQRLYQSGVPVESYIQIDPSHVCHILKNTKLFVGYQSGLNIIADNLDVPQIMLYFQILDKMQYTWCKRENINKKFQSALFSESFDSILQRLEPLKQYV